MKIPKKNSRRVLKKIKFINKTRVIAICGRRSYRGFTAGKAEPE
jgi:hypothetical protein